MNDVPGIQLKANGKHADVCEYIVWAANCYERRRPTIAECLADKIRATDGYKWWARLNKRKAKS